MPNESLPNQASPTPPVQNPSPNLLDSDLTSNDTDYPEQFKRISNSLPIKITIVLIEVVFLVVLGINYYLDSKIVGYQAGIDSLVNSIEGFKDTNRKVDILTKKTSLYKQTIVLQPNVAEKIATLIGKLPATVSVKEFKFDNGAYQLTLSMDAPIMMAQIISIYFSDPKVKEIVINSANLESSTGEFVITFTVSFTK